jgi:hypothetical protein
MIFVNSNQRAKMQKLKVRCNGSNVIVLRCRRKPSNGSVINEWDSVARSNAYKLQGV